ncbi:molybdate transporter subunit; membrane component of ABC superfamily [uncultured delta proteobacterium]|uniref:Molybdenum transport system permease n=1 Tax=uncultured delta proteobacterium TaxID=34034 RepID=A0A212JBH8_9DELT|nr:molybdate transporter subunit; membrane component of ABC superfamily [uncultured delta proteobacterium]
MDILQLTPAELAAMRLSLRVSGWAVVLSLPFGILAAWVLSRLRFPGRRLLDGVIHLPLVLPPVVIGYLLLVTCGKNGAIGSFLHARFGLTLAFTWKGAVLAAAVMAFPLMVRAIRLSMDAVDRNVEAAARTLGAGPIRVFFTITLPLALPGVITGTMLAFARSLGEFGATIMFVSNIPGQTQTLPLALYTFTQVPGGENGAMRLCVIAVVIAMAALLCSDVLARRYAAKMDG